MARQRHNSEPLYEFDAQLMAQAPLLCGVDEAGRGPLCGPVSIGAVILNPDAPIEGLDDSKRLTENAREILYDEITAKALAYKVVLISPAEIDRLNILNATLEGMRQAVEALDIAPALVLVDGNRLPPLAHPCLAVTKGDSKSACIAAASILAKVSRDRFMTNLDKDYPQYKLAQHKGYPTKLHYQLLKEHGVQSFYRQSFLKSFYKGLHDGDG